MQKNNPLPVLMQEDVRTPLYHQIFLILKNKILDGEYPDGAMLPSEADITAMFGVSRITATRALKELAVAGLVLRGRGRGTRVQYRGGTRVRGSMQSLVDSLQANGRNRPDLIAFEYTPASPEVASMLALGNGAIVQRAVRTYSREDNPFSHLTTYVPAAIGQSWSAEDLAQTALILLLENAGFQVERAEQNISAILADSQIALELKVSVGSPLLRIVRTTYAPNNVPVEYLVGLYPSDRYQFTMSLTKDDKHAPVDAGVPVAECVVGSQSPEGDG